MMNAREVAHCVSCMVVVWNPGKGFSEDIGRVQFSRNVRHFNRTFVFPVRHGKVRNCNVSGFFSWCNCVNNFLCRLIVFMDDSWVDLCEVEVVQFEAQALHNFGC